MSYSHSEIPRSLCAAIHTVIHCCCATFLRRICLPTRAPGQWISCCAMPASVVLSTSSDLGFPEIVISPIDTFFPTFDHRLSTFLICTPPCTEIARVSSVGAEESLAIGWHYASTSIGPPTTGSFRVWHLGQEQSPLAEPHWLYNATWFCLAEPFFCEVNWHETSAKSI